MAPDDQDPKVKDLIDAATQADLERWFGLPSFEQLGDQPPPPSAAVANLAPEIRAARERRDKALAAVDPALLDSLHERNEVRPEQLVKFRAIVDVVIDEKLALFDESMADIRIAEPREVEISDDLREDLKECTPQALLRDLHRPELDFAKTFEVVDLAADQRLDIVAEVKTAMSTRWTLPALDALPSYGGRALVAELHTERRLPWSTLPERVKMTSRRIVDE